MDGGVVCRSRGLEEHISGVRCGSVALQRVRNSRPGVTELDRDPHDVEPNDHVKDYPGGRAGRRLLQ
jgi:hypothetical protein